MNNDMLIRVTRYYRALNRLRAIGLEKVFAHNLADAAGVSAAIVRKDFSLLEIHGQKRGGYEIQELIEIIGNILGKGENQNVIVIGCGRIGKALMHYQGFEPDGIKVVAGFDTDPVVYSNPSHPIPVYPLSRLDEVIKVHNVKVAIITVPESNAQECYMNLLDAGITGVLNFSPITLKPQKTRQGIIPVVHNINIGLELEQIFYELKFKNND
ncbi:MAG: redox-sensing transcriptional repressor Rex [Spirochaetales bacterium]|uniref:redox-sensing transcriptional repressor Rex n=1 Tax=Bullifex sp. TaxID=2815808 RepID=UPI002A533A13|nr:redox-sensing transcriptional repressor Rex [Bullifex sp.]MDD7270614.1 redox-sensing transcriptional repressor Rex [Spirochaetales bacterium]MDY4066197.1 redox-sensing transcriptional repressor Rex [Bullifex sp.]